jgi:hypothetical protein
MPRVAVVVLTAWAIGASAAAAIPQAGRPAAGAFADAFGEQVVGRT